MDHKFDFVCLTLNMYLAFLLGSSNVNDTTWVDFEDCMYCTAIEDGISTLRTQDSKHPQDDCSTLPIHPAQ